MNIRIKFLAPLAIALLLAACSGGISGTYVDSQGNPAMKFSSGKAYLDLGPAGTHEMDYSVDGDKIVLHSPQGNLVLTREPDGSLDTPWGTWKKK
jgi:hypothetical protein